MNNIKKLRVSTDVAVGMLALAAIGIVLWAIDEVLLWNVLPDWLDPYVEAAVIVAAMLTAFALIASFTYSVTVVAESMALRVPGVSAPPDKPMSRRRRIAIGIVALLTAAALYGFHVVDEIRTKRNVAEAREKAAQTYFRQRDELKERIPTVVGAFTREITARMKAQIDPGEEKEISDMLRAIRASAPGNPDVKLIIGADAPYQYQIVTASGPTKMADGRYTHLERKQLIDLPTVWERDTVAALFEGAELEVPHGRSGAFIDTREPCAWGHIRHDDLIVGLILLRRNPSRYDRGY